MLATSLRRLGIFEEFQVDTTLPKFKKEAEEGDFVNVDNSGDTGRVMITPSNSPWTFIQTSNGLEGPAQTRAQELKFFFRNIKEIQPTLKNKIKYWIIKHTINFKKGDFKQAPTIDIKQFFEQVKGEFAKISGSKEVQQHYQKNMEQAIELGQVALAEKLKDQLAVILNECKLKEGGVKKYVTEDQIVKFYKAVGMPVHLKMNYIKNFTRVIPSDVIEMKKKADALEVFDNYVILHYDPVGDGESETKDEKEEREKDPILFGVMQNSNKLYFIADWIDEYCDLTLEKLLDTLGEKATSINNKTINSHMG